MICGPAFFIVCEEILLRCQIVRFVWIEIQRFSSDQIPSKSKSRSDIGKRFLSGGFPRLPWFDGMCLSEKLDFAHLAKEEGKDDAIVDGRMTMSILDVWPIENTCWEEEDVKCQIFNFRLSNEQWACQRMMLRMWAEWKFGRWGRLNDKF